MAKIKTTAAQQRALDKITEGITALKELNIVCAESYDTAPTVTFDLGIPRGGRSTENKTLEVSLSVGSKEYRHIIAMLASTRDKKAKEIETLAKKNGITLDDMELALIAGKTEVEAKGGKKGKKNRKSDEATEKTDSDASESASVDEGVGSDDVDEADVPVDDSGNEESIEGNTSTTAFTMPNMTNGGLGEVVPDDAVSANDQATEGFGDADF